MFTAIAHRYDFLNHALSLNIDRRWRRQLVDACNVKDGEHVLDVATGTGDVAIEVGRRTSAARIVGLDPSSGMLAVARNKVGSDPRAALIEANALALPFPDASFDVVTIAFGLRNLPDYGQGVREMARVLKPGGRLAVLEFLPPSGATRLIFRSYIATVLPIIGRTISGSPEAYRYLASSIGEFIDAESVLALLRAAGLRDTTTRCLTGGVSGLHRGIK
ncbi:MAG TPA: bifunctional demethylmenaquinone methyltransferase/2-methoxy-6-polyprenyl-1,4-benzoquinol methylase UbiE [Candidatus Krumholzibacteria bacterium]|nr:bifunctional demethylmenaquinone methyltransferase/2-methoxy-6-polyprenyl-1,4-benzoquinol methylase UbiE [Candidatus Krumholzibacteria bacterium]